MNYAAFYTSLVSQGFSKRCKSEKCIKSAPFIHMFVMGKIVATIKIC